VFVTFLVVGGVCTGIQYVLLVAFVVWMGVGPVAASTAGYIVSTAINYYLSHKVTFESSRSHREAFPRFTVVATVGVVLNGMIVGFGTRHTTVHYVLVQVAATAVVLLWNFVANLRWSFSAEPRQNGTDRR